MKLKIDIPNKYIPALKEISTTWGSKTIESFVESEILTVIKENLDSYAYDIHGNKIKQSEDEADNWVLYGNRISKPANVF